MWALFKRWWPLIGLAIYLCFATDFTISSLWTCHPAPDGSTQAIKSQYAENCSYLHGPFLISIGWLIDFIDEHDGFFTVLFTAGLVGFTAALWRSTENLWKAGERQYRLTRAMALNTQTQTRQSNESAADKAERELRAYIFITAPLSLDTIGPDKRAHFTFGVKNAGKTPAYRLVHTGTIELLPHPLPDDFPFPDLTLPKSRTNLAPDSPLNGHVVAEKSFSPEEWAEIFRGMNPGTGKRLYVFGHLEYLDCFQQKRWTRFCVNFAGAHELVPIAEAGNWDAIESIVRQPNVALTFETASQHNETEEG